MGEGQIQKHLRLWLGILVQLIRSGLAILSKLTYAIPYLVLSSKSRHLFSQMWAFNNNLPQYLQTPLPQFIAQITPDQDIKRPHSDVEDTIRNLADLTVLIHRNSPLGFCLRRSLTRYYYLRQVGLPVEIHFGAKFINGNPDRQFTGHAWLTLDDRPYFEESENWRGFTVMLSYPEDNNNLY